MLSWLVIDYVQCDIIVWRTHKRERPAAHSPHFTLCRSDAAAPSANTQVIFHPTRLSFNLCWTRAVLWRLFSAVHMKTIFYMPKYTHSARCICRIASLKRAEKSENKLTCVEESHFMSFSLCTEPTTSHKYEWLVGWMLQNFKFDSRVFTIYCNFLHDIVADQQVWKWQTIFGVLKRAAAEKKVMMNKWTWGGKKSDIFTIEFNIDSIASPAINARHAAKIYWVLKIIKKSIGGFE